MRTMTTAYDTQLFAGEIGFNSDSMGLEPPFISSVFGASLQQTSLLSDIINIMWRKSKKGGISSYLKLHFTNVKSLGKFMDNMFFPKASQKKLMLPLK